MSSPTDSAPRPDRGPQPAGLRGPQAQPRTIHEHDWRTWRVDGGRGVIRQCTTCLEPEAPEE